jgi:UDP-glucuronate decarboxylase
VAGEIIREDALRAAARLAPELRALAGRRLLLTGGTGFFGKWLLEVLLAGGETAGAPAEITVLTRDPERFRDDYPHLCRHPAVRLAQGDVRRCELPPGRMQFVIHAAASADGRLYQRDPLAMADTIVEGTRQLLEAVADRGVERFLFVSSGAVYGDLSSGPARVPETWRGGPDPLAPASAYGEAKRYAELLCALFREQMGVRVVVARPFAFVGPYQDLSYPLAATEFMRAALAGETLRISGDGRTVRSYMYAPDMAASLLTCLVRGRVGTAYNVGSDREVTVLDLARKIAALADPPLPVSVAQTPDADRPAHRYVPDASLIESELGAAAWTGLDGALERTFRWHQARERDG